MHDRTCPRQGSPQELPLNSLLVADWPGQPDFRGILAKALSYYAGSSLDRLGEHGAALILYDVSAGIRDFSMTLSTLRKHLTA